jgi:hypothetical protein
VRVTGADEGDAERQRREEQRGAPAEPVFACAARGAHAGFGPARPRPTITASPTPARHQTISAPVGRSKSAERGEERRAQAANGRLVTHVSLKNDETHRSVNAAHTESAAARGSR